MGAILMGAVSCSGDGTGAAELNPPVPTYQGSPIGPIGSGGADSDGSAVGAAEPDSANAGGPGAEAGAGAIDNGGSGAPPEGGPNAPSSDQDPADEEPPASIPTDVGFSDVFTVLSDYCTPCHAIAGSQLPAFAQDDADAAYEVTQEPSNYESQLYFDRIVERSVVERTMPPACYGADLGASGCVSERDAALLQAWIDQGAPP